MIYGSEPAPNSMRPESKQIDKQGSRAGTRDLKPRLNPLVINKVAADTLSDSKTLEKNSVLEE